MQRILQNKVLMISLALVGLAALAWLSAGVEQVTFQPPRFFSMPLSFLQGFLPTEGKDTAVAVPLWKAALVWACMIGLFALMVALLPPPFRKQAFRSMMQMAVFIAFVYLAMRAGGNDLFKLVSNAAQVQKDVMEQQAEEILQPQFIPPQPDLISSTIVSFIVISSLFAIGWMIFRYGRRTVEVDVRRNLAHIARRSIDDLERGQEAGDVIVRSYLRMNEAAASSLGVQRNAGLTPSEFVKVLEAEGLPGEPVRRLTGLFERVRYGDKTSTIPDQQEAIMCLNNIIQACEEKK